MSAKLPRIYVWFVESGTFQPGRTYAVPSGWYWGIVDGSDHGPFDSEGEALKDAHREYKEFIYVARDED